MPRPRKQPGKQLVKAAGNAKAATEGGAEVPQRELRYPDRKLPMTDVTIKAAFLDAWGSLTLKQIAAEVGCTYNHLLNIRTHPDYRKLRADIISAEDFDVSAELRLYMMRSLGAGQGAIEKAVEMMEAVDDDGLPQRQLQMVAVKALLENVARQMAAANQRSAEGAPVIGTAFINIALGHTGDEPPPPPPIIDVDIEDGEVIEDDADR